MDWFTIAGSIGIGAVLVLIPTWFQARTRSEGVATAPLARLAQVEVDLAATRRQLNDLENAVDHGFKSVNQRIVRSRGKASQDELELDPQALLAQMQQAAATPGAAASPAEPTRSPRLVKAR